MKKLIAVLILAATPLILGKMAAFGPPVKLAPHHGIKSPLRGIPFLPQSMLLITVGGNPAAGVTGPTRLNSSLNHSATQVTTLTTTLTIAGGSGHSLFGGCFGYRAGAATFGPTGISDNKSNTYSDLADSDATAQVIHQIISRADSPAAGSTTITCTVSAAIYMVVIGVEYSGMAASSVTDATAAQAFATSTAADSGNMTTTNASDLLIGLIGSASGTNPCTLTLGSGWASVQSETNTALYNCGVLAEKIVTSTGTYKMDATVDNAFWWSQVTSSKGQ